MAGEASQAWLLSGRNDKAQAAADVAVALAPDDPTMLVDRAAIAMQLGHYPGAKEDLDHAISIDPRAETALVWRAAALRRMGKSTLAQADVEQALRIDPENPLALLERGNLAHSRGDRAAARQDWANVATLPFAGPAGDSARRNLLRADMVGVADMAEKSMSSHGGGASGEEKGGATTEVNKARPDLSDK